jgi:hypothetical protein
MTFSAPKASTAAWTIARTQARLVTSTPIDRRAAVRLDLFGHGLRCVPVEVGDHDLSPPRRSHCAAE